MGTIGNSSKVVLLVVVIGSYAIGTIGGTIGSSNR